MSVTPRQFLALAQTLIRNHDEMHLRTAVNRSYYGAYHCCKQVQDTYCSTVITKGKGGSHEQLIHALLNCPLPDQNEPAKKRAEQIQKLGKNLKTCKLIRVNADYHIVKKFSINDAEYAVKLSKEILDTAEQILASTL